MEKRILVEAAYHAKIKAEILRAEVRLGMRIFPITQSYFDYCTYGDLKKDFPVQYKIFHTIITKLQSNVAISEDEISLMIRILPDLNNVNRSLGVADFNPNISSSLGLFPNEGYKGEKKVVKASSVEVVGKDTLEMALGKHIVSLNDVYESIESQLLDIIPNLINYLKGLRNGTYLSTRSRVFGEILLKVSEKLELEQEIKKGQVFLDNSDKKYLIYNLNYGEVIKPIGGRDSGKGETKHNNLKRYANPLDILNFVKQNSGLFEQL
jgi:hypothetical protein